ncbi:hypothetical protein F2P56_021931 [Juglans regia]|uniref:Uncharacterized protein LOC109004804 n=2 Tax=Juglans regia TaxID=51240 RepID=A0A2I4G558_JUGRE|nr:uncharacterized protein LOC109004804 [Juglans regia]KAF5457854.1 hypothetical protein F2P56_021931 [Juglans regia]
MGVSKAPISHLLLPSCSSSPRNSSIPNSNAKPLKPNSKTPLPNRRLFLLSLPLPTLLFPLFDGFVSTNKIQPSSCYALASFDPVSPVEREASSLIARRVSEAVELLDKGRELQAKGDFNQALLYFTQVVEQYKDFAFSDYARMGRALALYEVGDRQEAIAEMEDVSISLKGYPEVHAALAAALYVDKHAPLLAENQFTIATLLDPHYTDVSYVKETKHWPPSLVISLQHFISLT